MSHLLKSCAVAACALAAVLALSFVAMAWTEPREIPPADNITAPINTAAAAQTKAGDLDLGGKLSVAGDFMSGRFCLAGKCCATWTECFGVPTPPPPTCSCTSWVDSGCSAGYDGCDIYELRQTRTCNPAGCDSESRCVADDGCVFGGGCPDGYVFYAGGCCRLLNDDELSAFCDYNSWECGSYLVCGQQPVDCGGCAAGYCNLIRHRCCGGVTCQDMGYECGELLDPCGIIECGDCAAGPVFGKHCVDHKCVAE